MSRQPLLYSVLFALLFVGTRPASASTGENLLQYVPASTKVLVNIDMSQIFLLPWFQSFFEPLAEEPDVASWLTQVETEAGFDLSTDLHGLLISATSADSYVVLVEGEFQVDRILALIDSGDFERLESTELAGHTLYFDPADLASDRPAFTFLSDAVLLIGGGNDLTAALNLANGTGTAVTENPGFGAMLSHVDMGNHIWFALPIMDEIQSHLAGSPLERATSLHGTVDMTDGLDMHFTLTAPSEAEAATMMELVNQEVAVAQSLGDAAPPFNVNQISVSQQGSEVTIHSVVTSEDLESILQSVLMFLGTGTTTPFLEEPPPPTDPEEPTTDGPPADPTAPQAPPPEPPRD